MQRWFVFLFLAVIGLLPACDRVDNQRYSAQLARQTARTPAWVERSQLGGRLWAIERQFYADTRHLPAWIDGKHPTPQLKELLQALHDAEQHGLNPARYGIDDLQAQLDGAKRTLSRSTFDEARVPEMDLRLTYAFLMYAADLRGWSSSPSAIDGNWLASPNKADLDAALKAAARGPVRETLDALAPSHPQYKGLQAALASARQGDSVVARDADPEWRLQQIRMNLQRWRWMPHDLGDRHILIDVPAFAMQVVERDRPVLSMRVIVGKPDMPTPLFSDEMTYVVFSPYWNIPEKILREETLPRAVSDPSYLSRNNIEVVGTSGSADDPIDPESIDWSDAQATRGLRFRQIPGPDNALGLVKFIFPNHFSVYLHDTPDRNAFNRPKRALSHGCIRVENPVGLAQYVLRDKAGWTQERIVSAMDSQSEESAMLTHPLPVHIGYWTAWVNADGSVSFFDDPYGIDHRQAELTRKAAVSRTLRVE